MAMDFWREQSRARKQTAIYLGLFILLTLAGATILEFGMRYFAQEDYNPLFPYCGIVFIAFTCLAASVQYVSYMALGGESVAESMGGRPADASHGPKEAQLLNIVEECAIAASLPIPTTYIIDAEAINAFAAGLKQDKASITVTRGALELLSRDEMQAVVAHEFGHISNGDMTIGLRLAAMLMGFYFILYLAMRILQFSGGFGRSNSNSRGQNPVQLAALLLIAVGAFSWFFGSILKAAINRQREYLADASSVQFTRNPAGLASALRKIQDETVKDMPKTGMAYSHLYLDDHSSFSSLFATHPPLEKRIEAILPSKQGKV